MSLRTDWADGDDVYGADLNTIDVAVNAATTAAAAAQNTANAASTAATAAQNTANTATTTATAAQNAANTASTTVAATQTQLTSVATSYLRRPLRSGCAVIGDSISFNGGVVGYQPSLGSSWLQQIEIMTHGRIRRYGNYAVSGSTIGQALANQLPSVLAMNPLPGACVIASGTNDLWVVAAPNPNFSSMQTTLKQIVAALLNAGIVPILWTAPPNNNTTSGIAPANYQANIHQWNTWVRRYAAINGFALIDAHTALAAVDGTYVSGLGAADLIHPNAAGERAIAQKALADGLADDFPKNSLIHTARQTNDLSNLFNNGSLNLGLFTTDSNADGVADGLIPSGTATFALVAPVPSDDLYGGWQQMTVTAGNTAVLQSNALAGFSVGDTLAFSARIQTQGIEAAGANWFACVIGTTPGGYTPPGGTSQTVLYHGCENWGSDMLDGEIRVEFSVLSQMTALKIYFWMSNVPSGTAVLRMGEATVRDLTLQGALVA